MSPTPPYLSIVLAARNDNYGGDFNSRLHNCVHWLANLVEENKLPTELLIVDYNPVEENEPLLKIINWPANRNYLTIRFVHVPQETHVQLVNPAVRKTVPMFEFVAKNMGVRRAKGEYILCTNCDILFHPQLIEFIAQQCLDKQSYYRAERYDYHKIDRYDFHNMEATLRSIQQKVFRIFLKIHSYDLRWGENAFEITFQRMRHSLQVFLNYNSVKAKTLWMLLGMEVNYRTFLLKYHTNASGDFMLMHRDHWHRLRGYPEDTYISTHTDSIFCVMASIAGVLENILRWPVYHQDHERRYIVDLAAHKKNKELMDMLDRFTEDTRAMEASRTPKIVNAEDWGCGGEEFKETVV